MSSLPRSANSFKKNTTGNNIFTFENPTKTQGPHGKTHIPSSDQKTLDLGIKPKDWQHCFRPRQAEVIGLVWYESMTL